MRPCHVHAQLKETFHTLKKKTLHAHMLTHLCKFNSPNNTTKINDNKNPVHNMVLELCICVVEIFVGCNWWFWGLWFWVCGCSVCCWEKKKSKEWVKSKKRKMGLWSHWVCHGNLLVVWWVCQGRWVADSGLVEREIAVQWVPQI